MDNSKKTGKLDLIDKQLIIRDYVIYGRISDVCKKHGVSPPTVRNILNRSVNDEVSQKLILETKQDIIKRIWGKVDFTMKQMTEEKITRAAINQLVPLFGVLVEKGLLLQGEPTSISRVADVPEFEINKRLMELLKAKQEQRPPVAMKDSEGEGEEKAGGG